MKNRQSPVQDIGAHFIYCPKCEKAHKINLRLPVYADADMVQFLPRILGYPTNAHCPDCGSQAEWPTLHGPQP